ncbi:MAG: hypothetical protein WCO38_10370 [Verrucomicrobiota bacterium]
MTTTIDEQLRQLPETKEEFVITTSGMVLPPAKKFWETNSKYFLLTGIWPELPDLLELNPSFANNPNPANNNSPSTSTPLTPQQLESLISTSTTCQPYQMPLPKMLPYFLRVAEEKPEGRLRAKSRIAERYNYDKSPYYTEALRLIGESRRKDLSPNCQKVLALIIAWTQFDLFNGIGGRHGEFMTLSTRRLAKEINMSPELFRDCIGDLEGAGIILPGKIGEIEVITAEEWKQLKSDVANLSTELGGGEKGFWNPKSVQRKNWIYKLKVTCSEDLPKFNPFTSTDRTTTTNTADTNSTSITTEVGPAPISSLIDQLASRSAERPVERPAEANAPSSSQLETANTNPINLASPAIDLSTGFAPANSPAIDLVPANSPSSSQLDRANSPAIDLTTAIDLERTIEPTSRQLAPNLTPQNSACINENVNEDENEGFLKFEFRKEEAIKPLNPMSDTIPVAIVPVPALPPIPAIVPAPAPTAISVPVIATITPAQDEKASDHRAPAIDKKAQRKLDRANVRVKQLDPVQKAKLDFLTKEALLPHPEKGINTGFDIEGALALAVKKCFTLTDMKTRYEQVKRFQATYQILRNPHGFMYYALIRNLDIEKEVAKDFERFVERHNRAIKDDKKTPVVKSYRSSPTEKRATNFSSKNSSNKATRWPLAKTEKEAADFSSEETNVTVNDFTESEALDTLNLTPEEYNAILQSARNQVLDSWNIALEHTEGSVLLPGAEPNQLILQVPKRLYYVGSSKVDKDLLRIRMSQEIKKVLEQVYRMHNYYVMWTDIPESFGIGL